MLLIISGQSADMSGMTASEVAKMRMGQLILDVESGAKPQLRMSHS